MREPIVLGELWSAIAEDVLALDVECLDGDFTVGTEHIAPEGALVRAWCRAEAELLLADAAAMAEGTYRHRSRIQRRRDACLVVLGRFVGTGEKWIEQRWAAVGGDGSVVRVPEERPGGGPCRRRRRPRAGRRRSRKRRRGQRAPERAGRPARPDFSQMATGRRPRRVASGERA